MLQQSLGTETALLADPHAGSGVGIFAGQGAACATPVEGHATGTHRGGRLDRWSGCTNTSTPDELLLKT